MSDQPEKWTVKRSGSSKSDKELARAMVKGQELTFQSQSTIIVGYLAGWDDYTYFVITNIGQKHLIHKSGTVISFGPANYDDLPEEQRQNIEPVIASFRESNVVKALTPPKRGDVSSEES